MGSVEILFGREKGKVRLINPEIKTKSIGAMSFARATMIKKKEKRKKKKPGEPKSVGRGDNK